MQYAADVQHTKHRGGTPPPPRPTPTSNIIAPHPHPTPTSNITIIIIFDITATHTPGRKLLNCTRPDTEVTQPPSADMKTPVTSSDAWSAGRLWVSMQVLTAELVRSKARSDTTMPAIASKAATGRPSAWLRVGTPVGSVVVGPVLDRGPESGVDHPAVAVPSD